MPRVLRLLTVNLLLASWLAVTLAVGAGVTQDAGDQPPVTPTAQAAQTAEEGAETAPLPSDPFQRCALRVLAGEFGEVEPWKLEAYRRGLEAGVTVRGRAWVTAYYPWEGRSGRVDRRGNPCTLRTAAANKIPYGTYVWIENPCQMRQVRDCGAKRNDRIAQRKGARLWIDLWSRTRLGSRVTRYAVIGKEQP